MQIQTFHPIPASKLDKKSLQQGPEIEKKSPQQGPETPEEDGWGERLTDAAWTLADNILNSTLSYGIGGGGMQGTVTTSMVMNGLGGAVGGYGRNYAQPGSTSKSPLIGAATGALGGALDGALKGVVTVGLAQAFGGGLVGAAGAGAVLGLSQVVGGMLLREIG